jgi:Protein of unknown function (DUF2845)
MNPKQRHRPVIAAIALLLILHSQSAVAFRCGQKIVIKNMHELQVREACGEPTSERHLGVVVRSVAVPHRRNYGNGVTVERYPGYGQIVEEVVMTEYVYNFGPRKFMRRLIFEGGILVRIESIGYGYREKKTK